MCDGQVAMGASFLLAFRFTLLSIIPPILHTNLQLNVALTRRTNGQSLGTFRKGMLNRKSGSIG